MPSPILQPVVALVLWTFVTRAWLYATRIPAMQAANAPLDRTPVTRVVLPEACAGA